jgi:hypothetical protein
MDALMYHMKGNATALLGTWLTKFGTEFKQFENYAVNSIAVIYKFA